MTESAPVPAAFRDKYDEIVILTDKCCQEYLTEEYRDLCRSMAAMLCRKRPSPVTTGKASAWACGIVYSLGRVNFLFDKSQTPHLSAGKLCQHFALSNSTGAAKSNKIMDALNIRVMDPRWTLQSQLLDNPMTWLIEVNGIIVDARKLPRQIQEEAFRQGVIPFLP